MRIVSSFFHNTKEFIIFWKTWKYFLRKWLSLFMFIFIVDLIICAKYPFYLLIDVNTYNGVQSNFRNLFGGWFTNERASSLDSTLSLYIKYIFSLSGLMGGIELNYAAHINVGQKNSLSNLYILQMIILFYIPTWLHFALCIMWGMKP